MGKKRKGDSATAEGHAVDEGKKKRFDKSESFKKKNFMKKLDKMASSKDDAPKPQAPKDIKNGRNYTVSIAIPGSIVGNAQSRELCTYLAGQIARASAIFNIDEVVVYAEGHKKTETLEGDIKGARQSDPSVFLARVLQYLETPQYLRKHLFPVHPDLKYAGLLNPLDAPHHARATEWTPYREGVVLKRPIKDGKGCLVNVGLYKDARIDKNIQPGVRVTVRMTDKDKLDHAGKVFNGKAVSPSTPREEDGMYWGYSCRLVNGISGVFSDSPFEGGYDYILGTSEHGEVMSENFKVPGFKHLLIVFGGLGGIEESIETDQALDVSDPTTLFDKYINVCENQGSRTIRTEEAMLIALSALRPTIINNKPPQI